MVPPIAPVSQQQPVAQMAQEALVPSSLQSGNVLVERANKATLYAALGRYPNTRVGHREMRTSNNFVER